MDDNEKRKSISGRKLFLIAYICIFGFKVLFDLISELSSGGEDLPVFWMVVIIDAILAFIFVSPLLLITRNIKKADNLVKNESLSRIDFVNNKEYYRDILNKYSPTELSYIDDFNIDYPKDIIATLLSLVLKGKISIINNYITIVDYNTVDLKKSEIYVLENIKDGKVMFNNSRDIVKYIESEAVEDNLIKKSNFNMRKSFLKMKFGTISKYLIIFLIFVFMSFNEEKINSFLNSGIIPDAVMWFIILMFCFGLFMWFISISFGSFVKSFSYLILKSKSYERTDIGEELNKKIEGLKNYIKDFSILDEREQQELMIWEEYLIYSVLFNQNQKVVDDLSCLVEAEMEDGKVYFIPVNEDNSNK